MKKRPSDVTVIGDIVKRKKITFLKSSNLFSHEEQLFGKKEGGNKQSVTTSENMRVKNKTLIKSNLEEKKKIEGAIEKMAVGGDPLILGTIGRQI